MKMTLDYSSVRITRCHTYVGVTARIDAGRPVAVTIGHEQCARGGSDMDAVPLDEAFQLDAEQVTMLALLMTGRESAKPINDGFVDDMRKTIVYDLRSARRRSICDIDQNASTILQPLL